MRYCIRSRMGFLSHSHLSLFIHDSGIIKAPIPEAGSDGWRCEGSTGVDIRVHPLPAPSGATGGQEGGGNPDCYLNMCILELNTHLLMIYAHLFLHNNKAPSCLVPLCSTMILASKGSRLPIPLFQKRFPLRAKFSLVPRPRAPPVRRWGLGTRLGQIVSLRGARRLVT